MSNSIHLKLDEAARLRAALRSGDEHLSDEDLVNRAFDDGSEQDKARIDTHLARCGLCQQELARMRAIAADLNTEERRGQVDRLWNGFLAGAGKHRFRSLVAALRTIVLPVPRLATRGGPLPARGGPAQRPTARRVVAEGSNVDGRLSWQFTQEQSGGLKGLIVCSGAETLRGASVWLNTDPPRAVLLVESAGEQRAEFIISKEEWSRMARGPVVDKIVFANGEVITADD